LIPRTAIRVAPSRGWNPERHKFVVRHDRCIVGMTMRALPAADPWQ
jgi:hypothetical protein